MYKFLLYSILFSTSIVFASSDHLHSHNKYEDISIAYKEVSQDKYNAFVKDLSNRNLLAMITRSVTSRRTGLDAD